MSLIDDLKAGYRAGTWNDAPVYPNAVWTAKINLATPSITGLTFEFYALTSEFAKVKLFDIDYTEDVEAGEVVLYLKAAETGTALAQGCSRVYIIGQFTEDATGETYAYFTSYVPVSTPVISSVTVTGPTTPVNEAPQVISNVTLTPIDGEVGQIYTIVDAVFSGVPAPTIQTTLTQNGVDATPEISAGQFISTAAGDLVVTQTATNSVDSISSAAISTINDAALPPLEIASMLAKIVINAADGDTIPADAVVRSSRTLYLNGTGTDIVTTTVDGAGLLAAGFVEYSVDRPVSVNIADYGIDFVDGTATADQTAFDDAIYAVESYQISAIQALRDDARPLIKLVSPSGRLVVTSPVDLGITSHDFSNLCIFPTGSWSEASNGDHLVRCSGSTRGNYESKLWFFQNHDITRTDESGRVIEGDVTCVLYEDFNSPLGKVEVTGSYFHTLCELRGNTEKLNVNLHAEDGYRVLLENDDGSSPDQNKVNISGSRCMVWHEQVSAGGQFQISGDYTYNIGDSLNPETTRTDPLDALTAFHVEIPAIDLHTKKTARLSGMIRQNNNAKGSLHIDVDNGRGDYIFNDLLLMGNSGSAAGAATVATGVAEVVIGRCTSISGSLSMVDSRSVGTGIVIGDVANTSSMSIHANQNQHENPMVVGNARGTPSGPCINFNHNPTDPAVATIVLDDALTDFTIKTDSGVSRIEAGAATGCRVIGGRTVPTVVSGTINYTSENGT